MTNADIGKMVKAIHPGSYKSSDEVVGAAMLGKFPDKQLSRALLDGMTVYSLPHFMKVWHSAPRALKAEIFGEPHVKEIELLLKTMQTAKTNHLRDDEFGSHVADFMEGKDGLHPVAARILFTPSGARLVSRALTLKPDSEAFRSTLGILNSRYLSEAKK